MHSVVPSAPRRRITSMSATLVAGMVYGLILASLSLAPQSHAQGLGPDLALEKALAGSGKASGTQGIFLPVCKLDAPCRFLITVTNIGKGTYNGPIIIRDDMPPGWKFLNAKGSWSCQQKGTSFSCTLLKQSLAPNQPLTLDFELKPFGEAKFLPAYVKNYAEIDWKAYTAIDPLAAKGDSNPNNDFDDEIVTLIPGETGPDLQVYKYGKGPTKKPECEEGGICKYEIWVTNVGPKAYKGSVSIIDSHSWMLLSGKVTYYTHSSKGGWFCKTLNNRQIQCDYPKSVTIPNLSFLPPLTLEVRLPPDLIKLNNFYIKNCAKILWSGSWAGKGDINDSNDEDCVYININAPKVIGSVDFGLKQAEKCTGGQKFDPIYNACLCPRGETWSGDRCRCGWGLERNPKTKKCGPKLVTPLIPEPSKCPRGQQWDPVEKICAPVPTLVEPKPEIVDLALQKSGPAECVPDRVCLYKLTVTNRGPGTYEAPLTIIDQRPQGWKLLGGFPSPWKCTEAGTGFKCRRDVSLAPDQSATVLLELKVPAQASRTPREVQNCARIGEPQTTTPHKRRSAREVQQALKDLGYEAGPVDGKIGRQTRLAIRRYQEKKGLAPSGRVDNAFLQSLFAGSPVPFADSNTSNDQSCVATAIKWPPKEEDLPPPREPEPRVEKDRPQPPAVKPGAPKRVTCPAGQSRNRAGRCVCPGDQRWDRGQRRCVPREVRCPPGQSRNRAGQCVCPQGQRWDRGQRRCVPRQVRCPPGQSRRGGRCVCAEGYRWHQGRCVEREE